MIVNHPLTSSLVYFQNASLQQATVTTGTIMMKGRDLILVLAMTLTWAASAAGACEVRRLQGFPNTNGFGFEKPSQRAFRRKLLVSSESACT